MEAVVEEESGETEVGDGVEAEAEQLEEEHEEVVEAQRLEEEPERNVVAGENTMDGHAAEGDGDTVVEGTGEVSKVSMEDRLAKLRDLRIRMVYLRSSLPSRQT